MKHAVSRRQQKGAVIITLSLLLLFLLGFMGLYILLSMLFLFLVQRELAKGPGPDSGEAH